jgi:hypothetical protein
MRGPKRTKAKPAKHAPRGARAETLAPAAVDPDRVAAPAGSPEDAELRRQRDDLATALLAFFPPDRRDCESLRALLRDNAYALSFAYTKLRLEAFTSARAECVDALLTLFPGSSRAMAMAALLRDPEITIGAALRVALQIPERDAGERAN